MERGRDYLLAVLQQPVPLAFDLLRNSSERVGRGLGAACPFATVGHLISQREAQREALGGKKRASSLPSAFSSIVHLRAPPHYLGRSSCHFFDGHPPTTLGLDRYARQWRGPAL